MNTLLILLTLAVLGLAALFLGLRFERDRRLRSGATLCNAGFIGVRKRSLSLPAAATTASQNRLLKLTDSGATFTASGASEQAFAITPDQAEAIGDPLAGRILGLGDETAVGVASGAITLGARLVSGAAGTIKVLPSASGTHWVVGNAIIAAADTAEFEFVPCVPYPVVIA